MTSTERKLDEARYFLGQLKVAEPYFDYILSAYLNAARSTFWIMRFEFGKVPGWEAWFKSIQVTSEHKELLKKINDLRIASAKQSGVKTDFYFLDQILVDEDYYPIVKEIQSLPSGTELKLTISSLDETLQYAHNPDTYQIKGLVKPSPTFSESSRASIAQLCSSYFKFIQDHVALCLEKFNAKSA